MTNAKLVVDPLSISFRRDRPATGDIQLLLGSVVFPSSGWNDFVIVIVEAWCAALTKLVRGTSSNERVHFMEGPYAVDISFSRPTVFEVRALERPHKEHTVIQSPARALVEDAIAIAETVLETCRIADHRSQDVDQLAVTLSSLRSFG